LHEHRFTYFLLTYLRTVVYVHIIKGLQGCKKLTGQLEFYVVSAGMLAQFCCNSRDNFSVIN